MSDNALDRTGGDAGEASLRTQHDHAGEANAELLPCRRNDPELWFAESAAEVEIAKAHCGSCPVQQLCLAGALERREPWGVWGGQVFLQGVVIARKRGRGRPRKEGASAGLDAPTATSAPGDVVIAIGSSGPARGAPEAPHGATACLAPGSTSASVEPSLGVPGKLRGAAFEAARLRDTRELAHASRGDGDQPRRRTSETKRSAARTPTTAMAAMNRSW